MGVRKPLEERFWAKVDKTPSELGCWLWTGCTLPNGYGAINVGGRKTYTHRVSYELEYGELGEGLKIDHKLSYKGCPRNCVRPSHLRPLTNKQNLENRKGAQVNSKTGVRGVSPRKGTSKLVAQVRHNDETLYLGLYSTVEEAEKVVVAKRLELFTHNDHDRELVN